MSVTYRRYAIHHSGCAAAADRSCFDVRISPSSLTVQFKDVRISFGTVERTMVIAR